MRKLAISLYLALAAAPALAAPDYALTVLGRGYHTVFALNDAGVGVGNSADGVAQTFSIGGITPLGLPPSATHSQALGINDAGTIVGSAGSGGNAFSTSAFVLRNGTYGELPFQGPPSVARDVNNGGTVLVNYLSTTFSPGSYVWSESGGVVDLGKFTANGATDAIAINDRGQVVGASVAADGAFHAFLWENGTMTDLTTFGVRGEYGTSGLGISEQGDVFGTRNDSAGNTAWVIRDGAITWHADLSKISYIDANGRIFGLDQQNDAVIVDGATTTRIGDLIEGGGDWTFQVDAVNGNGDILTSACLAGECGYTVMLTAVPEPATYAMLLLGGLATGLYARRRRG